MPSLVKLNLSKSIAEKGSHRSELIDLAASNHGVDCQVAHL